MPQNTVWLSYEGNPSQLEISIADVIGNQVKQLRGMTDQTAIDLSGLKDGIYFVTICGQGSGNCKKLAESR